MTIMKKASSLAVGFLAAGLASSEPADAADTGWVKVRGAQKIFDRVIGPEGIPTGIACRNNPGNNKHYLDRVDIKLTFKSSFKGSSNGQPHYRWHVFSPSKSAAFNSESLQKGLVPKATASLNYNYTNKGKKLVEKLSCRLWVHRGIK